VVVPRRRSSSENEREMVPLLLILAYFQGDARALGIARAQRVTMLTARVRPPNDVAAELNCDAVGDGGRLHSQRARGLILE